VGVRVRDKDPRVEPRITNNGRFIVIPPSGRYIGFPKNWGASWELLYGYGRWTKYEVEPTKAHLNVYFLFSHPPTS
jgi:hypothetical protein